MASFESNFVSPSGIRIEKYQPPRTGRRIRPGQYQDADDPAVWQALRLLRTAEVVTGEKAGRLVRYRPIDLVVLGLLKQVT